MNRTAKTNGNREARLLGLALTTALAGVTLTGCATTAAPPAALSAGKAENALVSGKTQAAVQHAEAAVQADPRNASYRATLGTAYLDAGRFASAATTFDDAAKLGDNSPRTALSLALALAADGKSREALRVLVQHENDIPASDLGLAYALAGNPGHAVQVLSNAIRNGENNSKTRQNLAYAYALNGQWREARLMAAQDLPADKVGDRMGEWASTVHPDAYRERIAGLLQVIPDIRDPGQPVQLALTNSPSADQLAAEATAAPAAAPLAAAAPAVPEPTSVELAAAYDAPKADDGFELAPIGDPVDSSLAIAPYAAPKPVKQSTFETAFKAPETARASQPVAMDAASFVKAPAKSARPSSGAGDTHLVQLGSFSSEQGARRAWGIYVKRYPELADHDMVITRAVVNGKNYWRVSAGGYNASSSRAMCGKVKNSSSDGCFAYAEGRPLPGAIDNGRRLASR